jgi:hypothetical protein
MFGVAVPVSAAPVFTPVDVVVHTDFSAEASAFEGNIPGCETCTVTEGVSKTHVTPWGGVFVGVKEFTCTGGDASGGRPTFLTSVVTLPLCQRLSLCKAAKTV